MSHQNVLILDFGGQYNQLIARRVRDLGVYCEIIPFRTATVEKIRSYSPIGLIFTGGPNSVYAENAPKIDPAIFSMGIPVLGLCYGCQLIAHTLGGKVETAPSREFGKTATHFDTTSPLFQSLPAEAVTWMSHVDYVGALPEGFVSIAHTDHCPVAAMQNLEKKVFGFQYHPEVEHTENGSGMLRNFLYNVCGAVGDWSMKDYCNTAIEQVRQKVGDGKVLLALSGGVDSSVVAKLLSKAIGNQLTCIFVDHGLMRKNEGDEIEAVFGNGDINFVRVNAEERFLSKLAGVSEPERKRKIIGEEFIRVFEEEAKKIGKVDFLAQVMLLSSNLTTMSAVCRTMSTSRKSSSRCACCSRTRSAHWAESWVCRIIWSTASRSRVQVLPSASSARLPKKSWTSCAKQISSSAMRLPKQVWINPSTSILRF